MPSLGKYYTVVTRNGGVYRLFTNNVAATFDKDNLVGKRFVEVTDWQGSKILVHLDAIAYITPTTGTVNLTPGADTTHE